MNEDAKAESARTFRSFDEYLRFYYPKQLPEDRNKEPTAGEIGARLAQESLAQCLK